MKPRPLVQRGRRALNAVGDLAVDHHLRTVVGEKPEVRTHRGDLFFHGTARELSRIPAGDELESVLRQYCAQRGRFARELVAELEALVSDRLAFRERYFERRLAAQPRQVVVAPGDRVDADLHVEGSLHGCCFFLLLSYAARALRTPSIAETSGTATSHHQPPSSVVRFGS